MTKPQIDLYRQPSFAISLMLCYFGPILTSQYSSDLRHVALWTRSLSGDGLTVVHNTLIDLQENPQKFQFYRARFHCIPPTYGSKSPEASWTPTDLPTPDLRSYTRRQADGKRYQLAVGHAQSQASQQFRRQTYVERSRIVQTERDGAEPLLADASRYDTARDRVKNLWVEQGTWNDKWTYYNIGNGKHEELVSDDETDSIASTSDRFLGVKLPKPRREKNPEKIQTQTEIRSSQREASQPYYQFIYRLSKERERIQKEIQKGSGNDTYSCDVNTRAHNNIQTLWRERGIWNEQWGILPGMSWRHEQPWEEVLAEHGLLSETAETLPYRCDYTEWARAPRINI